MIARQPGKPLPFPPTGGSVAAHIMILSTRGDCNGAEKYLNPSAVRVMVPLRAPTGATVSCRPQEHSVLIGANRPRSIDN
jgi:hypothetical protein